MKKRDLPSEVDAEPAPVSAKEAKVLVVDDHPLLREGVARRINEEEDLLVCGQASNAAEAAELIEQLHPDIVILDLSLEKANGMSLLRDWKVRFPHLPILVLSMHDEMLYGERALHAGAKGYVMKQEEPGVLIQAIRQVLRGRTFLSQNLTSRILGRLWVSRESRENLPEELLSDREMEIFQLMGQGYGTREIAQKLGLSEKTISSHRENMKRKFNVKNSSALLRHAINWTRKPAA